MIVPFFVGGALTLVGVAVYDRFAPAGADRVTKAERLHNHTVEILDRNTRKIQDHIAGEMAAVTGLAQHANARIKALVASPVASTYLPAAMVDALQKHAATVDDAADKETENTGGDA